MSEDKHHENPFWVGDNTDIEEAWNRGEPSNPDHRDRAIQAMFDLIEHKIKPWSRTVSRERWREGPDLHDIEGIQWRSDGEYILEAIYDQLEYESDDKLKEDLEQITGLQTSSPEARQRLFEAWAAYRAARSVRAIAARLTDGSISDERAREEAERLFQALNKPIPTFARWEIAHTISEIAPDFAAERADKVEPEKVRDALRG